ncbi:AMP-binding protein, partial [Enterococcus faecalis]|nr:AMP-binding protein [Enterococcus faecalis]
PTILLILGRTEKLIECLLACLKLGATYIPVDPNYPRERIEYIIQDSSVDLLVTDKSFAKEFKLDCPAIELKQQEQGFAKDNLNVKVYPDQDAYRIYTSGSTGKPKGVRIPYKALTNFALALLQELPIDDCSTVLNLTTVSFDIFVVET